MNHGSTRINTDEVPEATALTLTAKDAERAKNTHYHRCRSIAEVRCSSDVEYAEKYEVPEVTSSIG